MKLDEAFKIRRAQSLSQDSTFGDSKNQYVPTLIREYASAETQESEDIETESNVWRNDAESGRLICDFEFDAPQQLTRFVIEVLDFQEDAQHHGVITIEPGTVHVEVWTHTLNDVTEIDHEYANELTDIYKDVIDVMSIDD
jgi:pterin-4a-carbinolamine dehydratase